MAKFILRRFLLLLLTMLLVSVAVFLIAEASPGNVAKNVLGAFITPEQEASFLAQIGLDKPAWLRYVYWLAGSDWHASSKVGLPLVRITTDAGFQEWWAKGEDGRLVRWKLEGDDLAAVVRQPDGSATQIKDNGRWKKNDKGGEYFWGVDTQNHVVLWEKGSDKKVWTFIVGFGWKEASGGPASYIPLKKGFIRGDPGVSLRTGRPVGKSLFVRLRNSIVLAVIAFIVVMPLALVLGVVAGLKEGSVQDRVLSVGGMMFSVIPEFATGIFLILILAHWLELVPGATVFGEKAPWERPDMLILPVLTLTLIELGYVLRITRASMAEVMRSPYIRTAFLKGLPYWRVVTRHAVQKRAHRSHHGHHAPRQLAHGRHRHRGSGVRLPRPGPVPVGFGSVQGYQRPGSRNHDYGSGGCGHAARGRYHLHVFKSAHQVFLKNGRPMDKEATFNDQLPAGEEIPAGTRVTYFGRVRNMGAVLWASKTAMVGLAIVLFWVFTALFAPWLTDYTPTQQDWKAPNQGPSLNHPLGTDELGRDLWSRLAHGARVILIVLPVTDNFFIPGGTALWGVFASLVFGATLGLLGGYRGGWLDEIIMRLLDAMMSVPIILLYLIVVAAIGASAVNVVIAIAIVGTPGVARLVRGLTLDIRTRDYIRAAETRGESTLFIMFVEILPNAKGPIIIDAMLRVGYAIFAMGTLGFLGLGLQPPSPDWGSMVAKGREFILSGSPWAALWPSLAIASLVVGLNLLADGLREETMRYQ